MSLRPILLSALLSLSLVACAPKAPAPAPTAAPAPAPTETAAPAATPAEPEIDQGRLIELLRSPKPEDAQAAIKTLERLSEKRPDDARIPYNMAMAWLTIGDENEARKRLLRATDVDPTLGDAWLNLGALSEKEGKPDRALASYEAGLRHNPTHNGLALASAGVLRQMNRFQEAEARAREVLRRDSNEVGAYDELGMIFLARNEVPLAKFMYDRALFAVKGAAEDPLIHAHFAEVLLAAGNRPRAREELEKALALNPNLISARLALSSFHMDNHDWEATVATLEPARDLAPNNPAIRVNLGVAYRGLGRVEDSKAAYQKALELDPSNPDPLLNIAILLGDTVKDFDGALATLDSYLAKGGTKSQLAMTWKTDIEAAKKKYEKAMERKRKQEEARKKSEERERLAAEAEARIREEEARQKAAPPAPEQAPPPPQDAPPPPPPADQGSVWPTNPPADQAPAGSSNPPPTEQPNAGGAWGATPANPAALGRSCNALGSCGDPSLECAQDAVCRPAGGQSTFPAGSGCMSTNDCAYGLTCSQNVCSPAAAPAANSPWN